MSSKYKRDGPIFVVRVKPITQNWNGTLKLLPLLLSENVLEIPFKKKIAEAKEFLEFQAFFCEPVQHTHIFASFSHKKTYLNFRGTFSLSLLKSRTPRSKDG